MSQGLDFPSVFVKGREVTDPGTMAVNGKSPQDGLVGLTGEGKEVRRKRITL